ncbi:MAG: amino acid ABC transporter permease [Epulopiscium sp.]|nr:amino acid ABC transporter permease [Candidatus Epulonipiscium sp.]
MLSLNLTNYIMQISKGMGITLSVFLVVLIFSIPLGAVVAILRLSKITFIRKITEFYIWILRGTPLLLQIIVIFYGLPLVHITFGRLESVYIAFILNYAAYFGEIFRSGIQSIERGQSEAASILGFTPFQIQTKIILPQVFKRTLPAVGNEIITLVKDTSLAYIVGTNEILKLAKGIANRDSTLLPYAVAGIMYLTLTYVITRLLNALEKRINYEE